MNDDMDETVYGTHDDSRVMSEKVQSLAAGIYKEFEKMIGRYDEDVVKQLMPLVVGILEGLDQSYQEKQEIDVELELLRDDNEQLLTQYEREKQLRKATEQKFLESEDVAEESRKEFETKIESLESIVRMFELKAKNAQDHVTRLEEREAELKKEYSKLHDRYTELFKTHVDSVERTKMLMGGDRIMELGASPRSRGGFHLANLRQTGNANMAYAAGDSNDTTPRSPTIGAMVMPCVGDSEHQGDRASLRHELQGGNLGRAETADGVRAMRGARKRGVGAETAEKEQITDSIDVKHTSAGTSGSAETTLPHVDSSNVDSDTAPVTEFDEASITGDATKQTLDNNNDSAITTWDMKSFDSKLLTSANDSLYTLEFQFDGLEDDIGESLPADMSPPPMEDDSSKTMPAPVPNANTSSIYDELAMQDADFAGEVDDGVDVTGMSKEVENLILENTELMATKNALNVVKDDLIVKIDELGSEQEILREEITCLQTSKERLKKRVSELEEEVKKYKEELDKALKRASAQPEDEDDVPMAQRKRFTRVEMARVLMERNQYKERLMELQEAVRWAEMIRASREHPDISQNPKKKSTMWNFFSNLFSSSNKPSKRPALPAATVKFTAPTAHIQPVGDPNKEQRDKYNLGEKAKAYDFMQDELLTEKMRKEREKERREQYKQVRAHVKKDDGRMQAYGWSLPSKLQTGALKENSRVQVPVPVPVYCRPLFEKATEMKLWCAAGVNVTLGKTKDGGSVVGASVFYSIPPGGSGDATSPKSTDDVERLDSELKEHEKNAGDLAEEKLSSLVWLCSAAHNSSRIAVVDANNPGDVLESFHVTASHILCIASVPGATEGDYPLNDDEITCESPSSTAPAEPATDGSAPSSEGEGGDLQGMIGGITFVQCATGAPSAAECPQASSPTDEASQRAATPTSDSSEKTPEDVKVVKATGDPVPSDENETVEMKEIRSLNSPSTLVQDGITDVSADSQLLSEEVQKMSSLSATMWLGSQSGSLYVHSAVAQWKKCLHSVKLKDSVLCIIHLKGRVFVGLANGSVAVFRREASGQWDLTNYHLIHLGKPNQSIRSMCIVANTVMWCACQNKIHIIHPQTLKLQKSFDVHPRKESQVRQMAWLADGVWISIRLDSTLRLYHAYTHKHLQDIDIEPYVSKMLGTGKLGFSFVRITSLLTSCKRLWIGTGNGVIISVPLSEANKQAVTVNSGSRPGGIVRVYNDVKTDSVTPGSFIPYCTMAQAQLSFHGHRDAVKFFVVVPGVEMKSLSGVSNEETATEKADQGKGDSVVSQLSKNMLVISGGEGYIDFRIGDVDEDGSQPEENMESGKSKGSRSHLIVWQVFSPTKSS